MRSFYTSSSFTRPNDTTAYADEDLIANSTTAGSVTPLAFSTPRNGRITQIRLVKSVATPTNANFSLYVFEDSPTVTNGDNGALAHTASRLLGIVALDMTTSKGSDDGIVAVSLSVPITTNGRVYGLLKAEAAYTPGALEVFTVTMIGELHV